ncbi:MAG: type II toxin-antitoxin system HicA family toxin [Acidobacteria bacterium]|nr:type II toxin-antitoxin system HicA family toxin [Acidobacteriota bacterium]
MPGKLRRLSGQEVAAILGQFGFLPLAQRGSHLKLRRLGVEGRKETLVVPLHNELDRGTLRSIVRQASRYISEENLRPYFFGD